MSWKTFTFALVVIALLIVGIYRAKYGARELRAEIAAVETEIAEAARHKAVLEADLSHMARREWIEEYARRELGMGPPRPEQFVRPSELDARLPEPQPEAGAPQ